MFTKDGAATTERALGEARSQLEEAAMEATFVPWVILIPHTN